MWCVQCYDREKNTFEEKRGQDCRAGVLAVSAGLLHGCCAAYLHDSMHDMHGISLERCCCRTSNTDECNLLQKQGAAHHSSWSLRGKGAAADRRCTRHCSRTARRGSSRPLGPHQGSSPHPILHQKPIVIHNNWLLPCPVNVCCCMNLCYICCK
jgi:hypothetical protein